jgi:hypothetical protein
MRNVQVRAEIGPDVANWPVASSKTRKLRSTTTVRMNVARSEPMFSTPILAKIAVRAANTADSSAQLPGFDRHSWSFSEVSDAFRATTERGEQASSWSNK